MNKDLVKYYYDRAKEYERIYDKPERQADLGTAIDFLQVMFRNKAVLEIACGTGYWTEHIAKTAKAILATDINEPVIEIAKHKPYPNSNVNFEVADIYKFRPVEKYESLFAGFIWSHILLQDLDKFITAINDFVEPGGVVVIMDNNYAEGSSTPVAQTDDHGNTYQLRKLSDNSTHQVLKNFPTKGFLEQKLKGVAEDIEIIQLTYFWILKYNTVKSHYDYTK
jgi:SAM-dependent methyltransferase